MAKYGNLTGKIARAACQVLPAIGKPMPLLAGFILLTPAWAAAQATVAAAPLVAPLAAGQSLTEAYLRFLGGLVLVIGVILVLYALLKKRFSLLHNRDSSRIHILEIKPLAPRKSLCLVEVGGQEFLLGLSQDSISPLAALGQGHSPGALVNGQPGSQSFDSILKTSQISLVGGQKASQAASRIASQAAEQP